MPRRRERGTETASASRGRRDGENEPERIPPKRARSASPNANEGRRNAQGGEGMAALRVDFRKKEASQLKHVKEDIHLEENRSNHRTDEYALESLIVRRGQEFRVTLTFDRPFDEKNDELILQLAFGNRPQESKQSLIRVKRSHSLKTSSWGMRIDGSDGNDVRMTLMSPANALVGEYTVFIETRTKRHANSDEILTFRRKLTETFIVLFNAWCEDDMVYMKEESHRQEYVLNDHGRIWVGSSKNFTGIPWNFGQFEDVSLPCCLKVLELSKLASIARGNATQVCRIISQMANETDDDGGILEGRWTETYPKNSTEPTEWVGSVAILKKFSRRYKVVRYGQCWVFSGLVTTLLRAIGIPTRSVTNFESAHDNDASMTIDFHFDKDGEPMDDLNDSIWNFHVWNESYFARPDLPPGYGGWQAHDATPQEASEGIFRCGPCPVKAIKEGEVYIPYDGGFIFGEVNGDRVYWEVEKNGEMTPTYVDKKSIGKYISTKAVGSNEREDLTLAYKYPEGSPDERRVVRQVNKYSSRRDENIYRKPSSNDIKFEAKIENDQVKFGEDVEVKLLMRNNSKEKRTVDVHVVTKMAFYTGVTARNLEKLHETIVLDGGEENAQSLLIKSDSYLQKTSADACIKIFFNAIVKETNQVFNGIDTVEFQKPDVLYTISDNIEKNKDFEVTFFLTNHLPVKLTNCVFNVETSRHVSPDTLQLRLKKPVTSGEEAKATAQLKASRGGKRSVVVSFKSDQLICSRHEIEFDVIH